MHLTDKYGTNLTKIRELNKQITKNIRKDIKDYNTRELSKVIEENKSLKVFLRKQSIGKKNSYKEKNTKGEKIRHKQEILQAVGTYNEISNKIHRAAVIIQSFFKGIVVRAQIRRMNAAATVIQRYCRGWLLRYHLPDIMAKVYERMCIKQYNTAAIKIQARWRGYLVRKYKICVKEIIEMRHTAEKANKDIKEQLQRPFSEIGLDEFQCNTKDAQKVFEILFDRHHLLRTQHIEGVLSQTGTQ
uniref:Spermatogenesis-associated protein 17-like n=1 Tax=Diabrotica virgifera virgifera TaxID=50390 RepID=A0A6P7GEC1_DIAVI